MAFGRLLTRRGDHSIVSVEDVFAKVLVALGADVNRGDNEGWTPLHATASCGFLSIAKFLLEHQAGNIFQKIPMIMDEK